MNRVADRMSKGNRCCGIRHESFLVLVLLLVVVNRESSAIDDSTKVENHRPDTGLSWCDAIDVIDKDGVCSCLRRACLLRRAIHDGRLRLMAGTPPQEFVFRFVPPGHLRIGLTDDEQVALARSHGNFLLGHNARPSCEAEFVEGFFILDREVTRDQFNAVRAWGDKYRKRKPRSGNTSTADPKPAVDQGSEPKASITWRDSWAFCDDLRTEINFEVRLPTEVEWEYAARGPMSLLYPGGNSPPKPFHADSEAPPYGAIVRTLGKGGPLPLQPSRVQDVSWCGVHDLSGNLSEWCLDVYQSSLKEVLGEHNIVDPTSIRLEDFPSDAKEASRAFRGANFGDSPLEAAAPLRRSLRESKSNDHIGLRPMLTLRFRKSKCERLKKDADNQNLKPQ